MNIVRHYQPGSTVVLFDQSVHQRFNGVLIFNQTINHPADSLQSLRSKMEGDVLPIMEKLKLPKLELPKLQLPKIGLAKLNLSLPSVKISISPFTYLVTAYTFLFLAIFLLTIYFLPILIYNIKFPNLRPNPQTTQKAAITNSLPSPTVTEASPAAYIDERLFQIKIAKINLEEDIIKDVDITNEDEYRQKLELGIAHARGSYLPGQDGLVYLFSHSTDSVFNILQYDAHFFGLKDIEKGDEIEIVYQGKKYSYVVSNKKVMAPNQVDEIRESASSLVLQTCWPFGTDWQRLVVFAEEIKKI